MSYFSDLDIPDNDLPEVVKIAQSLLPQSMAYIMQKRFPHFGGTSTQDYEDASREAYRQAVTMYHETNRFLELKKVY